LQIVHSAQGCQRQCQPYSRNSRCSWSPTWANLGNRGGCPRCRS